MSIFQQLVSLNVASLPWDWLAQPVVFLYFGPETILPVASFIAGIIGVIMMFWRYIMKSVRKFFKRLTGGDTEYVDPTEASFEATAQND